jgi:hypothetical protein
MPRILKACVYQEGKPIQIGNAGLDLSIKVLLLVVFIRCEWSIRDRSRHQARDRCPRICVVIEKRVR